MTNISNITEQWQSASGRQGKRYGFRDLSGEHLGVRIELLEPGATSSEHHYHTMEEEHVIVLEGEATLHLGNSSLPLKQDEHVWFKAGEASAHHIENTSSANFKYLVFGERNSGDVVVYPKHQLMLVKKLDGKVVTYQEHELNR